MFTGEINPMVNCTAYARADRIVAVDVKVGRNSGLIANSYAHSSTHLSFFHIRIYDLQVKPGTPISPKFIAAGMIDRIESKNAAAVTGPLQLPYRLIVATSKVDHRLSTLNTNSCSRYCAGDPSGGPSYGCRGCITRLLLIILRGLLRSTLVKTVPRG